MPSNYLSYLVATSIAGAAAWGTIGFPEIFSATQRTEVSAVPSSGNTDKSLRVLDSTPARTSACGTDHKFVIADVLNIRSRPGGGRIVGKLKKGTRLVITGCHEGWAQIGPDLWVSDDYLSPSRESSKANTSQETK